MLKYIILFISVISFFSVAGKMNIPEYIHVLSVDGKNVDNNFFSRKSSIEITAGKHILVLQYKEIFDDVDNDDHATIKSEPFVVLFTVNQSEVLTIIKPMLNDEKTAIAYAASPKITLLNEKNQLIPIIIESLVVFEAQAVFQQLADSSNEGKSNAALATATKIIEESSGHEPNAQLMLEYWWQKASDVE